MSVFTDYISFPFVWEVLLKELLEYGNDRSDASEESENYILSQHNAQKLY